MVRPVEYIYVDESGDIGVGPRSSAFFVVGATVTNDKRTLERLAKRTRRSLGVMERRAAELKFSRSSIAVRRRVLKSYGRTDLRFLWVGLRKDRFQVNDAYARRGVLQDGYSHLFTALLSDRDIDCDHIVIDSRKEGWMNELMATQGTRFFRTGPGARARAPDAIITRADSTRSAGLQITDFAVGAVFQMLERDSEEYYDLIRDRVCFGRLLE
jgi:hypothetical protein